MLPTIEHLIVLMMENRSFDHMLGFLKAPGYDIEGLDGSESNDDLTNEPVLVSRDAAPTGDLTPDPSHDFRSVNVQIFGSEAGAAAGPPQMSGFLQNYQTVCGGDRDRAANIMKCWTPARLPVLTTLAKQYAVCDHWYSSVPGPTLPNRTFAHAGTSRGRLDMSPDFSFDGFVTIYQFLQARNVSAKIYFHDFSSALTFERLLFSNQARFFEDYSDFAGDCKDDNVPAYCFIEPRYNRETAPHGQSFSPNDQHPDHDVYDGEALIADVYRALTKNRDVWQKSLLVIVYDEHGGLFDHVRPPAAAPPDNKIDNPENFGFDRLGVRVPAVLVSPYIEPGTIVSQIFDHTSFLGAARRLFTKDAQTSFLSDRDRQASTDPAWGKLERVPTRDAPTAVIANFPNPPPAAVPPAVAANSASSLSSLQRELLSHASFVGQKLNHPAVAPDPEQASEHDASAFATQIKAAALARQPAKD
ncbi:MAG: phosphoesterase [Acidobacteria bacterium]|nr:MAG: phosphoesterase [Acidobacteriota bacterium]